MYYTIIITQLIIRGNILRLKLEGYIQATTASQVVDLIGQNVSISGIDSSVVLPLTFEYSSAISRLNEPGLRETLIHQLANHDYNKNGIRIIVIIVFSPLTH